MEITKDTFAKLVDLVTQFSSSSTYELEGKYKGDVSREAFTRCLQYCKGLKLKENDEPESMDILVRLDKVMYRVSVAGKDGIRDVFKNNTLPINGVTFMKKTLIQGVRPFQLNDIFFKVDLKDELPVTQQIQNDIRIKFTSLDKGFRFKKRYSYIDSALQVRYDFSIVRTSKHMGNEFVCHKSMAQSQVLNMKETYEVEVEVIRNTEEKKDASAELLKKMTKSFFVAMVSIYLRLVDEKHYISEDVKMDVLKNYLLLTSTSGKNVSVLLKGASYKPKEYFIGPQPVTLERKNVIPPGLGITSIHNDYTVTEKADGERYLLFVNNDGNCYFINNRLSIKYTGVKLNTTTATILDGELITSDALGRKTNMFGIFDVYFINSHDVRSRPLVGTDGKKGRVDTMKEFETQYKKTFETNGITLFAKEFKYGENIFDLSKSILDKQESGAYPYKIDGLIFTPMHFAVGGQFLKDKQSQVRTWDKVFKWKPPHDNTIDFLVKYDKDDMGKPLLLEKDGSYKKIVTLFVGYNPTIHERLTAKKFLTGDVASSSSSSYIPKEFIPGDVVDNTISKAYLQLTESNNNVTTIFPKCLNGDVIEDNSIVEFAFNQKSHDVGCSAEKWVPLRTRHDKTEMLRKFGLSSTANDYVTAMNVWSSIQNPVTKEIISGMVSISSDDVTDEDVYFSSNLDRYKYASIIMKNFHNEFIKKRELVMKMPKGAKLFDIACGKAGDLRKWIDAGFSGVFGIDVFRDNIENRKNGAYARTLDIAKQSKSQHIKIPKLVFLTADASKKIDVENFVQNIDDVDDRFVANILWGTMPMSQIKDESLKKYYNFVKGGFDVISCQFAIHYFFENMETLDNFVYNVDINLRPGGYLIGTCLDGYLIKQKLAQLKKGEQIQGAHDDRVLWNIKKLYDSNTNIKLGEQIEIYMESIGKPIKEYLVDFNLLRDKLASKGIEVLTPEECAEFGIEKSIEGFKYSYLKVLSNDDHSQLARDIRRMTDEEKEYSFLNSWFIFKRH